MRIEMKPQTYKISAFPLKVILFPNEEIPLRIFEPRYKQLITECLEDGGPFGIPYIHSGDISAIGSEVEIVKLVGHNSNDDMVILIRGKSLFKTIELVKRLPDKLYGAALVETFHPDFSTTNPEIAVKVKTLKLNLNRQLGTMVITDSINLLDIATSLMLKPEEKYQLLKISDKAIRESYILNHLRFAEKLRGHEQLLEGNFQIN